MGSTPLPPSDTTFLARLRVRFVQFAYLPRAFRLVWAATRGRAVLWVALLVVQGLIPAALVLLIRPLVDRVSAIVGSGGAGVHLQPFLGLAAVIAVLFLLREVLGHVLDGIRSVQADRVEDHVSALVHDQSIAVDLAFYESPEFYDHLHRAQYEAGQRALSLLDNGGGLLQNGVSLVAVAAVLLPYGWWIPLLLVIGTLPALGVVVRHQWLYHRWWKETTAERRRSDYYGWMLSWGEAAPELRLFGWGPRYRDAFQLLRQRLREGKARLITRQTVAKLAAAGVALLTFGAVLAWLLAQAVEGRATLGDLALVYGAFSSGQGLMHGLLASAGQIFTNVLFLRNLFEFLDLEPEIGDPADPLPPPEALTDGIRFRGVDFHYPGSERPVLQNFDLHIPAGQTVAIVGFNGAGKSTLVKLLCRFYDPDGGQIEWDGQDLRRFRLRDLRDRIAALFQSPLHYYETAGENIALADSNRRATPAEIEAAAQRAGADDVIGRLPEGYDTHLGKWFADGAELSGGEWQRVALARAFLRAAPLVLLDEPTSAMDSWAEAAWLDRFGTLVRGRTAVIITHRFTTAMHADVIHLMDGGQIVESGTHDELLHLGGAYAQSWHAQYRAAYPATPSEVA